MSAVDSVQFERDIRSASRPFKRDRDHHKKWCLGVQVHYTQQNKVTPMKKLNQVNRPYRRKSHGNTHNLNLQLQSGNREQLGIFGRLTRKADVQFEIQNHTSILPSKSRLEYNTSVKTTGTDGSMISTHDRSKSSSSTASVGRAVDLGDLVEQAEKKWESIRTEWIVKDEYEVLDSEGETTVLRVSKGKGKRRSTAAQDPVEDDDGFELI